MIETTAATIAATADTIETAVFTIYLLRSVRSLDAGVSTSWLILSMPVM